MNDPLWSCGALQRHPQAVTQTHRDYIEAGADIIGTNTYQAHFQLFRKHLRFKASLALLKEKERHRTGPPWRKSRVNFLLQFVGPGLGPPPSDRVIGWFG